MPHAFENVGQELSGPPVSRAGSAGQALATQKPRSGLDKALLALSSFGTGIPAAEIDTRLAQNAAIRTQTSQLEQQAEQDRIAAQKELQLQDLRRKVVAGGSQADAALKKMFALDPKLADEAFNSIGAITQSQRAEASKDAAAILALPFDQRRQALLERAMSLEAQGRDSKDTLALAGLDEERQNIELRILQNAPLTAVQRQSALGSGAASKLGQSVVTQDPSTGELSFATPVLTGTQVETQQTPIAGEIVSRQLGETPAAVQQRAIETAGGTTSATKTAARDQEFIEVAQRQADGTAIIRRGLQLLETMETGTLEQAQLAGRNLLGIAGADETELNANLGKAVLAQLRSTFGAQFTEREGARLENVEAGFGKSTAGNRRLLEQTLRGMERDARRGITTAQRIVDPFSAKEIEDALSFSLDPGSDGGTLRFDEQGNPIQ